MWGGGSRCDAGRPTVPGCPPPYSSSRRLFVPPCPALPSAPYTRAVANGPSADEPPLPLPWRAPAPFPGPMRPLLCQPVRPAPSTHSAHPHTHTHTHGTRTARRPSTRPRPPVPPPGSHALPCGARASVRRIQRRTVSARGKRRASRKVVCEEKWVCECMQACRNRTCAAVVSRGPIARKTTDLRGRGRGEARLDWLGRGAGATGTGGGARGAEASETRHRAKDPSALLRLVSPVGAARRGAARAMSCRVVSSHHTTTYWTPWEPRGLYIFLFFLFEIIHDGATPVGGSARAQSPRSLARARSHVARQPAPSASLRRLLQRMCSLRPPPPAIVDVLRAPCKCEWGYSCCAVRCYDGAVLRQCSTVHVVCLPGSPALRTVYSVHCTTRAAAVLSRRETRPGRQRRLPSASPPCRCRRHRVRAPYLFRLRLVSWVRDAPPFLVRIRARRGATLGAFSAIYAHACRPPASLPGQPPTFPPPPPPIHYHLYCAVL